MYKIGVVGDKDSILGFKALGFDIFPADTAEEASDIIRNLADGTYAVLYVTEQIAVKVPDVIARYRSERFPAIIPIPGIQGTLGIGMQSVKQSVEKAVGADILFRDE